MTAIRSTLANAFETTLDAEMGPNDLVADVATIGVLTSPCYIVIEMDSDTQREYMFMDSTFGASTFVTSNIANRYLGGSGAGSNLTHPIGSTVQVVAMAQHFEDLHDRIEAITHTDGDHSAVNHHTLAGLGDDDHTQYLKSASHTDGIHDHGGFAGLSDDDHPQYLKSASHTDGIHDHGGIGGLDDMDHPPNILMAYDKLISFPLTEGPADTVLEPALTIPASWNSWHWFVSAAMTTVRGDSALSGDGDLAVGFSLEGAGTNTFSYTVKGLVADDSEQAVVCMGGSSSVRTATGLVTGDLWAVFTASDMVWLRQATCILTVMRVS